MLEGGVTQGCWPGAPVAPDRSPRQRHRHHLETVMAWGRGDRTCGTPSPIASPLPCPPCPLCSHPSILVWQPCIQTRCPSYLHRHRITLLEKSDSATSCLGFTTTWGDHKGQGWGHCWAPQSATVPWPGRAVACTVGCRAAPRCAGCCEGCWWCPWRVAPSPEVQWLSAPPAPPSPYLEGVAARRHVSDVNPLAVDVVAVGVPAPHAHPLLPKVGTGEASLQPCGREGR